MLETYSGKRGIVRIDLRLGPLRRDQFRAVGADLESGDRRSLPRVALPNLILGPAVGNPRLEATVRRLSLLEFPNRGDGVAIVQDVGDGREQRHGDARLIGKSRSYRVIRPTADFLWESHLDGSLPDGFSRHVPIPWLIRGLGLTADTNNLGVFLDAAGVSTIVTGSARRGDRGSFVLVRRDPFLDLARKNGLEPVWTVIGERRATTLEKKRHPDIRVRYNGLLWFEGKTEKHVHWSNND